MTNEFLRLEENDRQCQNQESDDECLSRKYLETIRKQCKCLPFNIKLSGKVSNHKQLDVNDKVL